MAVRIRLQRHGRKGRPFYYIVAADGRAKRDGRFIERFGSYNPMTNPATVDLDADRALAWLENGAEMSDTARAILSYRGVLYKHHLAKGVRKGAMTEEQAEAKYNTWLQEKEARIQAKVDGLEKANADATAARLKAEKAVSDARAAEIAAANAPVIEPVAEAAEAVEGEVAEAAEEATEAVEETAAEATEAVEEVAEAAEEAKEEVAEAAEEAKEEVAEAAEEAVAEATEEVAEAAEEAKEEVAEAAEEVAEAAEEATEEAAGDDAPAEEEDKA